MPKYQPDENRYHRPENWFRYCGQSGLKLPAVSLGCWHNFGDAGTDAAKHDDEKEMHKNARAMLLKAFDLGITHFDLANNYGPPPGAAEQRVGKVLKDDLMAHRDELIISSKAGFDHWPGPYGDGGSRKYLLASCDQSLDRLGVDYVDIFYHHRPDKNVPLEETMGALDQIVRSGKALYAGISNYDGERTRQALAVCKREGMVRPIIHQQNYSMLNRKAEADVYPATGDLGLGVTAFCPLAQGLLTDKYLGTDRTGAPDDSRAKQKAGFLKEERITPELLKQIGELNELAKQRGQSLAQMALAWTLRDQGTGKGNVTSALIGASRPSQIEDNAKLLENGGAEFSDEELGKIEAILQK